MSARPRFAPVERREAILSAAREVFTEHGFAKARTKDIAARAGVAEGLVFTRFKTKDALFEAVVTEALDGLVRRVSRAATEFAAATDQADRTAKALEFHTEILETMVDVGPLLGAALFERRTLGEDFYLRRITPTLDHISHALSLSLGGTAAASTDARLLAQVVWGTHFSMAVDAAYRGEPLDVRGTAKKITKLLAAGLGLGR